MSEEKQIKNDIADTLFKILNIVDKDNNGYLIILSGVTLFICMTTGSYWYLMGVVLAIYVLYNTCVLGVYWHHKRKLKRLYQALAQYMRIDKNNNGQISLKKSLIVNWVAMIVISLLSFYLYI